VNDVSDAVLNIDGTGNELIKEAYATEAKEYEDSDRSKLDKKINEACDSCTLRTGLIHRLLILRSLILRLLILRLLRSLILGLLGSLILRLLRCLILGLLRCLSCLLGSSALVTEHGAVSYLSAAFVTKHRKILLKNT